MRWQHTVGEILSTNQNVIETLNLNGHQRKHLSQLTRCHTEASGGIRIDCVPCGHTHYIYHSCRNRHCPSCQGSKREQWIARQQQYLLNIPYFHVVFTIPHSLNHLCLLSPKIMYNLLFEASWATIQTFANDKKYLNAKSGMTAVLHTWSQNIGLHPHLHCIVPGGGITSSGKWKRTRTKGKYLFPGKALKKVYKGIFLKKLKGLASTGVIPLSYNLKEQLYNANWVVYAKRPFGTPHHVIEYLGRYTHKIAISNYRISEVNRKTILFKYKDYRHGAKQKIMSLTIKEFIRRFSMHILPHRFVRIRHYGILSFRARHELIPKLQQKQNYQPIVQNNEKHSFELRCPKCKSTEIVVTSFTNLKSRAP